MKREYFPFIDWMKFLGIVLIVNGHVSTHPLLSTAPIYEKQLGVAFFIFVMGFSLAREVRQSWRVVYNRLFEIYLFGFALALLLSACGYVASHDVRESNYAPFVLGLNVFVNFFPANPTTWFLGTYLHLLLFWAWLLRRVRIRRWMIAASVLVEIVLRAIVVGHGTEMIAYMILPNWSTAFLLGLFEGQRKEPERHPCGGFDSAPIRTTETFPQEYQQGGEKEPEQDEIGDHVRMGGTDERTVEYEAVPF